MSHLRLAVSNRYHPSWQPPWVLIIECLHGYCQKPDVLGQIKKVFLRHVVFLFFSFIFGHFQSHIFSMITDFFNGLATGIYLTVVLGLLLILSYLWLPEHTSHVLPSTAATTTTTPAAAAAQPRPVTGFYCDRC